MSEIGQGHGSGYPDEIDTDNSPETTSTMARPQVPNDLASAIIAVQTELGINPAGLCASTVVGRFDDIDTEIAGLCASFTGLDTRIGVSFDEDGIPLSTFCVPEFIYHCGDLDTYLRFTPDRFRIVVGAVDMLDITEAGADTIVFNEGGVDVDFRVEGVGAVNAFFVQGSDGKIGIGTSTIPHGGVGMGMLVLEGPNANVNGPHVQFTTALDDYPLMQFFMHTHDAIMIEFDAYYDYVSDKSSDVGSNFRIGKAANEFVVQYDSGIAQGANITWNEGFQIAIDGGIFFDNLLQQSAAGLVVEYVAGTGEIFAETSAKRFKQNIENFDIDGSKLLELKLKSYIDKESGRKEFGFIAEDVAVALPELVVFDEGNKPLGIKYTKLSVVLLNELKKMNRRYEGAFEKLGISQRELLALTN